MMKSSKNGFFQQRLIGKVEIIQTDATIYVYLKGAQV